MDNHADHPRQESAQIVDRQARHGQRSCACLLQRAPDEEAQLGVIQFLGPLSHERLSAGCVAAKVTSAPVPRTTARRTGAPSWSRSSRKTASALGWSGVPSTGAPPHGVSQPRRAASARSTRRKGPWHRGCSATVGLQAPEGRLSPPGSRCCP